MPRVAYSEEDRKEIRTALVTAGLELMSKQGIQHTTVEQIYKMVGISRTFFYSFFSAKEELVVEILYQQQPRLIEYAKELAADPALSWNDAVRRFLYSCCYGEKNGIMILTLEEQQLIYRHLSAKHYKLFREKQFRLFAAILECFKIEADAATVNLFINLSLTMLILRKAIPHTTPLFVPEAADETVTFQINAIVNYLESLRNRPARPGTGAT